MSFLDLFRRKQAAPQIARKESAAYALHMVSPGQAQWSLSQKKAYAEEGYVQNVVVYQAINKISEALAAIPLNVFRGETELTASPLLDLMKKPNPAQSTAEFWQAAIGFLMIYGNLYLERSRGSSSRPVELWPLRSDRMVVLPAATGLPQGFEYKVGQRRTRWEADPVTGDSDIRHIKLFHPLDDWYGLSPIHAAAYAIDQHNEAMAWMQALLQNSARPSGALVVAADQDLSDDQFARLKAEVEDDYSGSRNAGRPMLLEGGMDWKPMGLSPSDVGIIDTKNSAARDISLALGVPPLLLNIPGDSTYSNYKEARLAFYEDTVIPLCEYILAELNAWLSEPFGGQMLVPDYDAVEAIAEKRQTMWEMADRSLDLTLDESRAIKGYPPIGGELGNMLMADIRRPSQSEQPDGEQGEELKRAETILQEMAYGKPPRARV